MPTSSRVFAPRLDHLNQIIYFKILKLNIEKKCSDTKVLGISFAQVFRDYFEPNDRN